MDNRSPQSWSPELEDQTRYIAWRLGEAIGDLHREVVTRALSPQEIDSLVAELTAYDRFLLDELAAGTVGRE